MRSQRYVFFLGRHPLGAIAVAIAMIMTCLGTLEVNLATSAGASPGPDPAGTVYVSDCADNAIDVFAPGATGNVAPERSIQGPDTGLSNPCDVQVDSTGNVYAGDLGNGSITEYAPQASGDATPICTIIGSNTGLTSEGIDDFSLEANGTLVVGTYEGSSVLVFAPGSCGNVAPTETIAGSNTGFNVVDGVGTDAQGTIYACSSDNNSINVFPAGANGNVAPESTITGPDTGLTGPDDIVVGFGGELYVSSGFLGSPSLTVYAPGASGDATPTQDITGTNTGFAEIDDLAVDDAGNIYTTDVEANDVAIFAAGATGNVAPTAVIGGSNTTFGEPEGVAVAGPQGPPQGANVTTSASATSISLGQSTSDSATVTQGANNKSPTGSLVFRLFGPNDSTCSAAPAFVSSEETVTGAAVYKSPPFTPTAAGTYNWQALYSGDANNGEVTTPCRDPAETVTVGVLPTSLATSLSGNDESGSSISVPLATPVTDNATVSGTDASTAAGSVIYNVYSDSSCSILVSNTPPETITTPGTLPPSAPVTFTTAGTYYWQALYSGDSANAASMSPCGPSGEIETVGSTTQPTTLTTSLSGGGQTGASISVPLATPVTDNATVSGTNAGTATGTVAYSVYSDPNCTVAVNTESPETITTPGILPASTPVSLSTGGTYYWQASYSGDSANAASTSACGGETETVTTGTGIPTITTLTTRHHSVTTGTPVTFVAKVAPHRQGGLKATGTVGIHDNGG